MAFDGIVRDGSKRDMILPPLGTELTPEMRELLVESYGEKVAAKWEADNAAFLSSQNGTSNGGLSEEEEIELLRELGYEV